LVFNGVITNCIYSRSGSKDKVCRVNKAYMIDHVQILLDKIKLLSFVWLKAGNYVCF